MYIKNLSDKEGIRIIIELRKDADVKQNINILYKKAKLEDTFGYNATLLSHKKPSIMSVSRILKEYLEFYREVLTRKYQSLLDKETKAAEIKAGLIKAVDIIDTIVEVLRGSKKVETAKRCLIDGVTKDINFKTKSAEKQAAKLCFTELQANAILEMRLQKLIGLELDVLTKELAAHNKNISEYSSLLNSKTKMTHKMRDEMLEIKKQYAKPRKTDGVDAELVVIKPQEVKPEKMWVVVNRFGYIKLIDEATKNRNQASLDKDYKYVCEVMNTGTVFVFTMNGKCHLIKAMNIPYQVNHKIVRGLDYYTKTVFELITKTKDGNLTVCGGGRYDHLVEQLGGPDIPAVGFGMGIERVLALIDGEGIVIPKPSVYDVFVTYMGDHRLDAFRLVQSLRASGLKADMDHCSRSLKAQFKYANKTGSSVTATIGDEEAENGTVKLRNMETREEISSPLEEAAEAVRKMLG